MTNAPKINWYMYLLLTKISLTCTSGHKLIGETNKQKCLNSEILFANKTLRLRVKGFKLDKSVSSDTLILGDQII